MVGEWIWQILIGAGGVMGFGAIRGWLAQRKLEKPDSLPIEHKTAKEDAAAKSAWRTLAKYASDRGKPQTVTMEDLSDLIQTEELQWPSTSP